jgi:hypothetical protein
MNMCGTWKRVTRRLDLLDNFYNICNDAMPGRGTHQWEGGGMFPDTRFIMNQDIGVRRCQTVSMGSYCSQKRCEPGLGQRVED